MSQAVKLCDGLPMSVKMQEVHPSRKILDLQLEQQWLSYSLINVQWTLHPIDLINSFILLPPNYRGISAWRLSATALFGVVCVHGGESVCTVARVCARVRVFCRIWWHVAASNFTYLTSSTD